MTNNQAEQASYYQFNEVLIDTIDTLQEELCAGLSEYELISLLQAPPFGFFDEGCLSEQSTLFKTHFILFHCLYRLQQRYLVINKGYLEIHTLRIHLKALDTSPVMQHDVSSQTMSKLQASKMSAQDELAHYYLDWSNYKTTDKEIDDLLASFWERFVSGGGNRLDPVSSEDVELARAKLNIPASLTLSRSVLKQYYRKTLQQAHPDKGGCKETAQAVIASYKMLLRYALVSD